MILIVVVILVLVVPIILAAILFVMVSGLIGGPILAPVVIFGTVTQSAGNATLPIAFTSGNIDPGSLEMQVQVNYSGPVTTGMPSPNGGPMTMAGAGHTFWVYWVDADHNGLVSSGDSLRVTGANVQLPVKTVFTFSLRSPSGSSLTSVTWTTP